MSQAVVSTGIFLQREGVTVAELRHLKSPAITRNKIPTTTHNDGTESNTLGILMQGDLEAGVNWLGNDATHIQIRADIAANTKALWSFVFPSTMQGSAHGRVSKWDLADATVDGLQMADIAIVWAEPITFLNT